MPAGAGDGKRGSREARNVDLVWFVLIGVAAGWLAGQLMGSGGPGLVCLGSA